MLYVQTAERLAESRIRTADRCRKPRPFIQLSTYIHTLSVLQLHHKKPLSYLSCKYHQNVIITQQLHPKHTHRPKQNACSALHIHLCPKLPASPAPVENRQPNTIPLYAIYIHSPPTTQTHFPCNYHQNLIFTRTTNSNLKTQTHPNRAHTTPQNIRMK